MIIKEYDVSPEVISDDLCKDLMGVMTNGHVNNITIERYDNFIQIFGKVSGVEQELIIHVDGSLKFYRGHVRKPIPYVKNIIHMVNESQWRDTKVKLPEQDQEVFIKTNSGINRATYYVDDIDHGKQLFDLVYMQINKPYILPAKDVDFWLPADNVIL